MSCSGGEKPDGHQGCLSHSGDSCKCSTPVELVPGTLEVLDEAQGIQQTKMSLERRKEVFIQQLDLSGLEGWSKEN